MHIFFIFTPIPGEMIQLTSIFLKWVVQPPTINLWLIDGLGWWFGYLRFPYARDCCLGAPLESPTTNHCLISLHKPMGGIQAGGMQQILPMGFLWETLSRFTFCKKSNSRVSMLLPWTLPNTGSMISMGRTVYLPIT